MKGKEMREKRKRRKTHGGCKRRGKKETKEERK